MTDFYAGLISGLISNFVCNPFDVVRTNKQIGNRISYNFSFLYKGVLSGLITIPTYWSFYFYSYENLKKYNQNYFSFINGYIASNISSTITCPLWFIRQKNQTSNNFNLVKYYKNNGIKPFYNALTSTYIINASFIIQMPVYEYLKQNKKINNLILNDTLRIFLITSFAKTIASCVFYPIDTIRAIQRENHKISFFDIYKNLKKKPVMFYSGLSVYLLRSIPYHSTTFCTFEYFKSYLKKLL